MKLKVGDGAMFKNFLGAEPVISVVTEVYPNGIPSCREPMLKLDGHPGVVLESHCALIKTAGYLSGQEGKADDRN